MPTKVRHFSFVLNEVLKNTIRILETSSAYLTIEIINEIK